VSNQRLDQPPLPSLSCHHQRRLPVTIAGVDIRPEARQLADSVDIHLDGTWRRRGAPRVATNVLIT
jgi:hypothetical protein